MGKSKRLSLKPKVRERERQKSKLSRVFKTPLLVKRSHRFVFSQSQGVNGITMDKEKQLVTVKGTMDVKKLVESLTEKLKRPVEIVPPAKKDKENGSGKDNESGDKKKGGDGGGKDNSGNKGGGEGVNMMEYMAAQPAYGYGYYPGGPYGYPVQAHAPQIFSDENPNACVVM